MLVLHEHVVISGRGHVVGIRPETNRMLSFLPSSDKSFNSVRDRRDRAWSVCLCLRWVNQDTQSLCVSPRSVTSDGSKRVEASSRGDGSWRQDVWYAAGWVEAGARVPRPQRVNYHPTTTTRPEKGGGGGQFVFPLRSLTCVIVFLMSLNHWNILNILQEKSKVILI